MTTSLKAILPKLSETEFNALWSALGQFVENNECSNEDLSKTQLEQTEAVREMLEACDVYATGGASFNQEPILPATQLSEAEVYDMTGGYGGYEPTMSEGFYPEDERDFDEMDEKSDEGLVPEEVPYREY